MPSDKLNLVTGATGQLGSHIVEQLRLAGEPVRALVRPGRDLGFLQSQGVEIIEGDGWRGSAVRGGAAVVFGILALAWPTPTVWVFVALFGVYALELNHVRPQDLLEAMRSWASLGTRSLADLLTTRGQLNAEQRQEVGAFGRGRRRRGGWRRGRRGLHLRLARGERLRLGVRRRRRGRRRRGGSRWGAVTRRDPISCW